MLNRNNNAFPGFCQEGFFNNENNLNNYRQFFENNSNFSNFMINENNRVGGSNCRNTLGLTSVRSIIKYINKDITIKNI